MSVTQIKGFYEMETRWYFNKESGDCKEFYFGGCDGNENNFETETECRMACKGGL
jgi:hypothetical protein